MIFAEITDINLNYLQKKGKNTIPKNYEIQNKILLFSDNLIATVYKTQVDNNF